MATAGPAARAVTDDELRNRILSDPRLVLDDPEVMRALVGANDRSLGGNIVDFRGMAMERLETRLHRLEETHRAVIAAAYENLAGTNQIHRALLRLLDPTGFEAFLRTLGSDVADILRVDAIRLVLETTRRQAEPALERVGDVLMVAEPDFVADYMNHGRPQGRRQVVLRETVTGCGDIYAGRPVGSEALLRLDLGEGRLPGMLAMGSEDPQQFRPGQGTDLLSFFAGVFERTMRRWLS